MNEQEYRLKYEQKLSAYKEGLEIAISEIKTSATFSHNNTPSRLISGFCFLGLAS